MKGSPLSTGKDKGEFAVLWSTSGDLGRINSIVSLAVVQKRYTGPESNKVVDNCNFAH